MENLSIKSKRFIARYHRFAEYANIDPARESFEEFSSKTPVDFAPGPDQDDVLTMIFAPDPLTGVPRSDLALVVNKDVRPEVSQYIQNVLQHPVSASDKVQDVDMALASVKDRFESFDQYAERLRSMCSSEIETLQNSDQK